MVWSSTHSIQLWPLSLSAPTEVDLYPPCSLHCHIASLNAAESSEATSLNIHCIWLIHTGAATMEAKQPARDVGVTTIALLENTRASFAARCLCILRENQGGKMLSCPAAALWESPQFCATAPVLCNANAASVKVQRKQAFPLNGGVHVGTSGR